MGRAIRVAAGVLADDLGRVLLCRRRQDVHLPEAWEFPGGKCEVGESYRNALDRELREELGIEIRSAQPLIRVSHQYEKHLVTLDVWRITEYEGTPTALEDQPMEWVAVEELSQWALPAADQPIVELLERRAIFK